MSAPAVTVFFRPGCPFCSVLLRRLDRRGVPHERIDIWQDEQAAAMVRRVADGNETVPTVRVGERWMVNPSMRALLRAMQADPAREAGSAGQASP